MKLVCSELADSSWQRWKFALAKSLGWWMRLAYLFNSYDPVAQLVVREWVESVSSQNGLRSLDDWQNKTTGVLPYMTHQRLACLGHTWTTLLQILYPEYPWKVLPFERSAVERMRTKKSEKNMAKRIKAFV